VSHPTATDGVWRVMRFENAEGKWAEVASNVAGPEAVPLPEGFRFVCSTPMVPCDVAAVERGARAVSGGLTPTGKERRLAEAVLRAAGEAP
jgi:hypothetical protein